MFDFNPNARRRKLMVAVSLVALGCMAPAFGQSADPAAASDKTDAKRPKVSDSKPTSPNATINLVNLLVKQGVLTGDQATALIKQADDEAYVSRQASKNAASKADEAAKVATAAASAAEPAGTRHVTYVPEIVKRQLREDIKKEVMAKAEKENWASPGMYPEWAQRIHFYGDFRARYQGSFFPTGNDQADAINFNAVNSGSPYDLSLSNLNPIPTNNATQNRNQARLRARLGMDADLTNGFSAGIRIATGQDNSPVSTNQTLGGGSGDFSKYALWLDRGYLKYETMNRDIVASVGRFDNPFWSATDLVWYSDLAMDGIAIQAKHQVLENLTPFAVVGAFPTFNTDFNAGTSSSSGALPSHDKWMYGGQAGFAWQFDPVRELKVAIAYYDFDNVQGQASATCSVLTSADSCSSDLTRPLFAQKGNTYMFLRNIAFDPSFSSGLQPGFQYFGLVQKYRPVVASASLDFGDFAPYHVVLDSEFVWNSAFRSSLNALGPVDAFLGTPGIPINNISSSIGGSTPVFNGGDIGWMTRLTVGNKKIQHLGDWNASVAYKYLESDAVLDAFTDPDFGLGGTNLKGYIIGANYGLSENVWASMKWMSANNIGGVPYAVDVLQVDLNAKF